MGEQLNVNETCPHCKESWDGGDIRQVIGNLDIHQFTDSKKLDALAAEFGWTPENKKRFSKVKMYQLSHDPDPEKLFAECSHCGNTYRLSDGKHIGTALALSEYKEENDEVKEEKESQDE
jgi:hypothetical protein